MSLSREQIGRGRRWSFINGRWHKRQMSRWRRRQQRLALSRGEEPVVGRDYVGFAS